MKPTLKRFGKHSDSLVPTGKKRGSSQQKSAIGKTENSSLNCRDLTRVLQAPNELARLEGHQFWRDPVRRIGSGFRAAKLGVAGVFVYVSLL